MRCSPSRQRCGVFRHSCAYVLLIAFALSPGPARAALFDEREPLAVSLSGPFKSVFRDTGERMPQRFTLNLDDRELDVAVRVRGHSRVRVCAFPPLRLDFRGSDSMGTAFAEQGKLKLVTHCRNHASGTSNLLEEFAAYRMFNVLTDVSFRVRLLRINYADSEAKLPAKASPNYAFLIEPPGQLRDRLGAGRARLWELSLRQLDERHAALVYVFQYLIGNTDWSLVRSDHDPYCCHNGDLIAIDGRLFLLPFDFDLAGLVNASYAAPDPSLRIDKVTTRRYRGYCVSRAALRDAVRRVVSQRAEILAVLDDLPAYPQRDLNRSRAYLERFFSKAGDEVALVNYFEERCLR